MTRRASSARAVRTPEPQPAVEEHLDRQGETRPHLYGWCNDGFHAGRTYRVGTPCPGGLDNHRPCECSCHGVA